MIDYAKVALITLIIFGVIILGQNIYIMSLTDKNDVQTIKTTARYGSYISGIMIGVGALILVTVLLTEKGLKYDAEKAAKLRTTSAIQGKFEPRKF